jgi:hypothetical protein
MARKCSSEVALVGDDGVNRRQVLGEREVRLLIPNIAMRLGSGIEV